LSGGQFRELLKADRPRIGTWISIPAPYLLEILGSVGFDWLCIDMQHGLIGDDLLPSMLMAAAVSGTPALVRTRWNEPAAIMRSLDAGAAGVIVPLVNDRDEALSAARACRYPPNGFRSWGPMRPLEDGAPGAGSDDGALCIVMVETQQAAAGAAAIASAPGVDGVFVGPSDLSLSVAGRLGADISAQTAAIAEVCAAAGIVAGIACGGSESVTAAHAAGFRLLTLQWDVAMVADGASSALRSARSALDSVTEHRAD
jgi:4-hydroxy-2-oxoheptanedioate aldolase